MEDNEKKTNINPFPSESSKIKIIPSKFDIEKHNVTNNKSNPYDLEININSILGFLKGWDIVYGKNGRYWRFYWS